MRLILALALALPLAGCGGSGGGGAAFPSVEVGGNSPTVTASHSGTYDLNIGGNSPVVTTAASQTIRNVNISSNGGGITIGASSTVSGSVQLGGNTNVLHLPSGSMITVHNTGNSCTVVYDSVAAISGPG